MQPEHLADAAAVVLGGILAVMIAGAVIARLVASYAAAADHTRETIAKRRKARTIKRYNDRACSWHTLADYAGWLHIRPLEKLAMTRAADWDQRWTEEKRRSIAAHIPNRPVLPTPTRSHR